MIVLRVPTPLRGYADGQSEVQVSGETVSAALEDLIAQYPNLKPHLYYENGQLRPFVNVFLGEDNIKDLQGVDTPVKVGDRLLIIPSIAGGRSRGD